MRTKYLMLLILLLSTLSFSYAQSHISTGDYWCKLKPRGNQLGYCPACAANDKKDLDIKKANEKREQERLYEEYRKEKEKIENEREAQRIKDLEDSKSGEVHINMPSSSASSSSENGTSESSEGNSSKNSSSSQESVPFDYNTYYKYYATPEEKRAHETQQLYNSAAELGASLAQWQADRERKWAQEQAKYAAEVAQQRIDKTEYEQLISSTNIFLLEDLKNYYSLLSNQLPNVLENDAITWAEILGSNDYTNLFGKNATYVYKKVKWGMYTPFTKMIEKNDFDIIHLPNYFTSQSLKLLDGPSSSIYYWVKRDFYAHDVNFIFDDHQILVGIQIELMTRNIHIKDYYDDLIQNLSKSYLMADAKTFVTKDKICVLDWENLTIFDLNYLQPSTYFQFPESYTHYFNPNNEINYINHLGIKIEGARSEEEATSTSIIISEILPNSIAQKNELQIGDVILKINDVLLTHPTQLQWFFHAYPKLKTFTIHFQRGNELKSITFTIN